MHLGTYMFVGDADEPGPCAVLLSMFLHLNEEMQSALVSCIFLSLRAQPFLDPRGKAHEFLCSQLLCPFVSLQEAGAGQQLGCDPPRSATVPSSHCSPNHEGKRLKAKRWEDGNAGSIMKPR